MLKNDRPKPVRSWRLLLIEASQSRPDLVSIDPPQIELFDLLNTNVVGR